MKLKQSKRFRVSSRTASRRTESGQPARAACCTTARRGRRAAGFVSGVLTAFFLMIPATSLFAQRIEAVVTQSAGQTDVSLRVRGVEAETVLDPLASGLESEIEYIVRQYTADGRLTALLGDRLLAEERRLYTAEWDPFADQYVLRDGGGEIRRFDEADELLRDFFSVGGITVPPPADGQESYLMVQARLQPIRFVPALGILAILLPDDTIATPWHRVPLQEVGNK